MMPRRRLLAGAGRGLSLAALGALGTSALAGCGGDWAAGESNDAESGPGTTTGHDGRGCAPAALPDSPSSAPEEALDGMFTRYGDSSGRWSGADSTYSVQLSDGRIAWLFSDTFYGPVDPDGARSEDTPFLHNSVVLQAAPGSTELRTVVGRDEGGGPTSLVPAQSEDTWCWLGAGRALPDGGLQVTALTFEKTGDGPLDFAWKGTEIVTLDLGSATVTGRIALPHDAEIQWSSWLQDIAHEDVTGDLVPLLDHYTSAGAQDAQAGLVVIHGVRDGETKTLHVAAAPASTLEDTSTWRYWDGDRWSDEESDAAVIHEHVANELSVTPFADGFLLITQDTSEPYSPRILAASACGPQGPFDEPRTVFRMPEAGPRGTYGDENVYGYNAHEHPELRDGRTVVVSYNVNSLQPDDLYEDATIYRPRFVRIEL